MKYANLLSGQIIGDERWLPTYAGPNEWPSPADLWKRRQAKGWRGVAIEDAPSAGCRITSQGIVEIDADTCHLTVTAEKNIAEEEAARAAAERQDKLDNFRAHDIDLLTFAFNLRNLKVPDANKVTLAEAKEVWRKIVDKEI